MGSGWTQGQLGRCPHPYVGTLTPVLPPACMKGLTAPMLQVRKLRLRDGWELGKITQPVPGGVGKAQSLCKRTGVLFLLAFPLPLPAPHMCIQGRLVLAEACPGVQSKLGIWSAGPGQREAEPGSKSTHGPCPPHQGDTHGHTQALLPTLGSSGLFISICTNRAQHTDQCPQAIFGL